MPVNLECLNLVQAELQGTDEETWKPLFTFEGRRKVWKWKSAEWQASPIHDGLYLLKGFPDQWKNPNPFIFRSILYSRSYFTTVSHICAWKLFPLDRNIMNHITYRRKQGPSKERWNETNFLLISKYAVFTPHWWGRESWLPTSESCSLFPE